MCMRSAFNVSTRANESGVDTAIHAQEFRKTSDQFVVIDVREPNEVKDDVFVPNGGIKPLCIPSGELMWRAQKADDVEMQQLKSKRLVLVCSTSHRSSVVAKDLQSSGYDACHLAVLGHGFDKIDQATMALSFANASINNGKTVALALTSDGVSFAEKSIPDLHLGDPFKRIPLLRDNFLKAGGDIFCCTSCLVLRKIDPKNLVDGARKCSAPDIVRWLCNAQGSIQYT